MTFRSTYTDPANLVPQGVALLGEDGNTHFLSHVTQAEPGEIDSVPIRGHNGQPAGAVTRWIVVDTHTGWARTFPGTAAGATALPLTHCYGSDGVTPEPVQLRLGHYRMWPVYPGKAAKTGGGGYWSFVRPRVPGMIDTGAADGEAALWLTHGLNERLSVENKTDFHTVNAQTVALSVSAHAELAQSTTADTHPSRRPISFVNLTYLGSAFQTANWATQRAKVREIAAAIRGRNPNGVMMANANEPGQGSSAMPGMGADRVSYYRDFADDVAQGGQGDVTPGLGEAVMVGAPALAGLASAGPLVWAPVPTPDEGTIDPEFTFHFYNNGGLRKNLSRRSATWLRRHLKLYGPRPSHSVLSELDMFYGANFGIGVNAMTASWQLEQLLALEADLGIPTSRIVPFYGRNRGFDNEPSGDVYPSYTWQKDNPFPVQLDLWQLYRHTCQAGLPLRLSFGEEFDHDVTVCRWRRQDGTGSVLVKSDSMTGYTLRLRRVGGTGGPVQAEDHAGNPFQIQPDSDGLYPVPVGIWPTYLLLEEGAHLLPVDEQRHQLGAQVRPRGLVETFTPGGSLAGMPVRAMSGLRPDARWYNAGQGGDPQSIAQSALSPNSGTPIAWQATWDTPTSASHLRFISGVSGTNSHGDEGHPLAFTVHVRTGGGWEQVANVDLAVPMLDGETPVRRDGGLVVLDVHSSKEDTVNGYREAYGPPVKGWGASFARRSITGVRITASAITPVPCLTPAMAVSPGGSEVAVTVSGVQYGIGDPLMLPHNPAPRFLVDHVSVWDTASAEPVEDVDSDRRWLTRAP